MKSWLKGKPFNSKYFYMAISIVAIVAYAMVVSAAQLPNGTPPPTGGYLSGNDSILDPGCAPQSANCVVTPYLITTSTTYNWIGDGAGQNGGSTDNTVFIGIGAGDNADNADYSNFIGTGAGLNATNADHSNFFGQLAGCNATDADNANFFGYRAGCGATFANNSNFFGNSSGEDAVNGAYSTYFGDHAGFQATDAAYANFLGALAGYQATNAYNSNFLGYRSGYSALNAHDSNFFGYQAGEGADSAHDSVMIGNQAGFNAQGLSDFLGTTSNPYGIGGGATFIGAQAGYGANSAQATIIGTQAGYKANTAFGSTIMGFMAGYNTNYSSPSVANLSNSLVLGTVAAQNTSNVDFSMIVGTASGNSINDVYGTMMIGSNSVGSHASSFYDSILIGNSSGGSSTDFVSTTVIGPQSGTSAQNLFNAIVIGSNAGDNRDANNTKTKIIYTNATGSFPAKSAIIGNISNTGARVISDNGIDTIEISNLMPYFTIGETITDNETGATAQVVSMVTGTTSILIGDYTDTGGYQNSIAFGTKAINSADNQFMIGSSDFPIDEIKVIQSGGTQCIIDLSGLGCTSDERMKTNIEDLPQNILDLLSSVRTVKYNWKSQPEGTQMIGFLAQNLETNFPQAVATDKDGKKSVYYSQMIPVVVEAVKELNLKVSSMQNLLSGTDRTFVNQLVAWLGDKTNGLKSLFADSVHANKEFCLGDRCITEAQFNQLLDQNNIPGGAHYQGQLSSPDPVPTPEPTPSPDQTPVPEPAPEVTPTPEPVPENQPTESTDAAPSDTPTTENNQ